MACITQFSSMIDKNAMRYMKQRYFGYTDELNDVHYLKAFLDSHTQELNKLDNGQFLYYNAGKTTKISVDPYRNDVIKTEPKIREKPKQKVAQTNNNTEGFFALFLMIAMAFVVGVLI